MHGVVVLLVVGCAKYVWVGGWFLVWNGGGAQIKKITLKFCVSHFFMCVCVYAMCNRKSKNGLYSYTGMCGIYCFQRRFELE